MQVFSVLSKCKVRLSTQELSEFPAFNKRERMGRPKLIILLRHGESQANVCKDILKDIPDHRSKYK